MKLSERVDKLEEALVLHLTESGEIRTGIKTLNEAVKDIRAGQQKAFWTILSLTVTSLVALACAWIRSH